MLSFGIGITGTLPALIKFLMTSIMMAAVLSLLSGGTGVNAAPDVNFANAIINHGDAMIDWVRSKGGFFSDKLEIRRMDPQDDNTPFGIFAKADVVQIEEGERLLEVPRQCYLRVDPNDVVLEPNYQEDDVEDLAIMGAYFGNACRLAHKLLDELKVYRESPQKSDYAPFLAYLETTQAHGQLPATYSTAGKDLLRTILGPITSPAQASTNYGNFVLPPWLCIDWIDEGFLKASCFRNEKQKQEEEHAIATVIQRGYDTELIPIWDMANHVNGDKLNTDNSPLRSPEGLKVWASQPIQAGEEIYATYNYCTDCEEVGDVWGTPGIFRDFGFVEDYPQVWPFLDHDIWFELQKTADNTIAAVFTDVDENGQVIYGIPDDKGLVFLREQLQRLEGMDLSESEKLLPPHEWDTINKFYQANLMALTKGIDATLSYQTIHKHEEMSGEEHRHVDEL